MVLFYMCDLYLAFVLEIHTRDHSPMIDNSLLAEVYEMDL